MAKKEAAKPTASNAKSKAIALVEKTKKEYSKLSQLDKLCEKNSFQK